MFIEIHQIHPDFKISETKIPVLSKPKKQVAVFPGDNIIDIRKKIQLLLSVPIYRQGILIKDSSGLLRAPYVLIVGGAIIKPDINTDFIKKSEYNILGLNIDEKLYQKYQDGILFEFSPKDTFLFYKINTTSTITSIQLYDFDEFILSRLKNSQIGVQEQEMIYYGLVIKYWPQITFRVFKMAIEGRAPAYLLPPLDYPVEAAIAAEVADIKIAETSLLTPITRKNVVNTMTRITKITYIRRPKNVKANINLRNLFDLLKTSSKLPIIGVDIGHQIYKIYSWPLAKTVDKTQIDWIKQHIPTEGLILLYLDKIPTRIIIKKNGEVNFSSEWEEKSNISVSQVQQIVGGIVEPIIKQINMLGLHINLVGDLFSFSDLLTSDLNLIVRIPLVLTEKGFNDFRREGLADYYNLGYIYRSSQSYPNNSVFFYFVKEMMPRDFPMFHKLVKGGRLQDEKDNIQNLYNYMSDKFSMDKWNNYFANRLVKVYNSRTHIRVDMDVRSIDEAQIIIKYIYCALRRYAVDKTKATSKLIEQDPELFDLKQHDPKSKVYARICQLRRMPVILSSQEARTKKHIVELQNFTTGERNYYFCPNPAYPYIQTKSEFHPKGYPLPCCYKLAAIKDTISYTEHIMKYGRTLQISKISYLPPQFPQYIHNEYHLVGVRQTTPSSDLAGLGYSFEHIFGPKALLTAAAFLKRVNPLAAIDFKMAFGASIEPNRFSDDPGFDIFSLLAEHLYDVSLILIEENIVHIIHRLDNFAVIVKTERGEYYPVIDSKQSHIFGRKDKLIMLIMGAVKMAPFSVDNIAQKYQIDTLYVNKQGLCFAADLVSPAINISVLPSAPIKGPRLVYGARNSDKIPDLAILMEVIGQLYRKAKPESILFDGVNQVGIITDGITFPHKPATLMPNLRQVYFPYPLSEIEAEITKYKAPPVPEYNLYKFVVYEVFKNIFVSLLHRNRKGTIRGQIIDLIEKTDFGRIQSLRSFNSTTDDLLAAYPSDKLVINEFLTAIIL